MQRGNVTVAHKNDLGIVAAKVVSGVRSKSLHDRRIRGLIVEEMAYLSGQAETEIGGQERPVQSNRGGAF